MNKGIRPDTIERYLKVKRLVSEGVELKQALLRFKMSSSIFHKLRLMEKNGTDFGKTA